MHYKWDWYGNHFALWPSATLYWGKTYVRFYLHFLTAKFNARWDR